MNISSMDYATIVKVIATMSGDTGLKRTESVSKDTGLKVTGYTVGDDLLRIDIKRPKSPVGKD